MLENCALLTKGQSYPPCVEALIFNSCRHEDAAAAQQATFSD